MGNNKSSKKHDRHVAEYIQNKKACKNCGHDLDYASRHNSFCNHSCAASYNNVGVAHNPRLVESKPCGVCHADTFNPRFCSRKCSGIGMQEDSYKKIESGEYTTATCDSKILKKYLIEKRGRKCEDCGRTRWKNQLIPLDVHHKDGDATNNSLENIGLLCLNCHGLTLTYGARNKGSGKRVRWHPE